MEVAGTHLVDGLRYFLANIVWVLIRICKRLPVLYSGSLLAGRQQMCQWSTQGLVLR